MSDSDKTTKHRNKHMQVLSHGWYFSQDTQESFPQSIFLNFLESFTGLSKFSLKNIREDTGISNTLAKLSKVSREGDLYPFSISHK